MPQLDFEITGVRPEHRGMTPLLTFDLHITNKCEGEYVQSLTLEVQIRLEASRRAYNDAEKERLVELFGPPREWGRTLRDTLWTHVSLTVPGFVGKATATLSVPCTYDLNVASAKYLYALEADDIPLIFLFSGTVFYAEEARLLVQRIPWDSECRYGVPVERWKSLMEHHYPESAWMCLSRDVFESLYAYRRRRGIASWDAAVSELLQSAMKNDVAP